MRDTVRIVNDPSHTPLLRAARCLRIFVESRWAPRAVFAWCAAVQVLYFAGTPYMTRAHDSKEHIDYVMYVLRHFSIPPAALGWEMHQPPLYYFLSWGWLKAGATLGRTPEMLPIDLQTLALALSMVTLGAILWIGMILFPGKKKRPAALLFGLILGTLPGIAMTAARVNNDALAFPLSFLWCGWMLLWWKNALPRDFWLATVTMGFCMLTKFTSGVLVIPMVLMIALHPTLGTKMKIRIGHLWGLALVAIAGWYYAYRTLDYLVAFVVPGVGATNAFLLMETRLSDFLIFNPLAILLDPFANPWDPLSGRQYFFEYLLRSAFFGEWQFPHLVWLARLMIAIALVGIPAGIVGVMRSWRKEIFTIPFAILVLFPLVSLAIHRTLRTCSCDQDFRFIPLIAVPVVFWILTGFVSMNPHGARWGWAWAWMIVALQSAFLLSFLVTR